QVIKVRTLHPPQPPAQWPASWQVEVNLVIDQVRPTVGADEDVLPFAHIDIGDVASVKFADQRPKSWKEPLIDVQPGSQGLTVDPVVGDCIGQDPPVYAHWTGPP